MDVTFGVSDGCADGCTDDSTIERCEDSSGPDNFSGDNCSCENCCGGNSGSDNCGGENCGCLDCSGGVTPASIPSIVVLSVLL